MQPENQVIAIQARSTSSRLPGKVLELIGEKTLLEHVYLKCLQAWDMVCVLVPSDDDQLINFCAEHKIPCFTGPENDVLYRYREFVRLNKISSVVRITSDCPFINPADIVYARYLYGKLKLDFISNCIYPCSDGAEVEIISRRALEWLHDYSKDEDREHVTTYLKKHLRDFTAKGFKFAHFNFNYPLDWFPKFSIDTQEDLNRCREINKIMEAQCKL